MLEVSIAEGVTAIAAAWAALTILVLFSLAYTLFLFEVSRQRRTPPLRAERGLFFVVVLPCLNEERVIEAGLQRLLELPQGNFIALVVDDGSDDATAQIVSRYRSARIHLMRRVRPDARQGKGAALNAAYKHLLESDILGGRRPEDVVVVVLDADGRLQRNAFSEVAPFFRDPLVGAVQIGVRMYNAREGLLARLQDMEFVVFTEIFQRARDRLSSVGLGGNGQFTRLAALKTLPDRPWTECLTEDLELGIRLRVRGWVNRYCSTSFVSQQAVTTPRRLIRQRARWFHGHLQCWSMLVPLLRSNLPGKAVFDIAFHLLSPALMLITGLMTLTFVSSVAAVALVAPDQVDDLLIASVGLPVVVLWYLLAAGLAYVYGFVYWLSDSRTSLVRSLVLAHLYVAYAYLWFPAGFLALWRIVRGQKGWAKTQRTIGEVAVGTAP